MRIPRVKICGIATLDDALVAVDAGADAVGLLVGLDYPSPDRLEPAEARAIARRLPLFVTPVLVTHRTEPAAVLELCRVVASAAVQLHGGAPRETVATLRRELPHLQIFTAVHVPGTDTASPSGQVPGTASPTPPDPEKSLLDAARAAAATVDAVILDSRVGRRVGGTGRTHDWRFSRRVREELGPRRVVLAGGLDPDNVAAAITAVGPWAVDVNTGVSAPDGRRKDPAAVARFVAEAKATPVDTGDGAATEPVDESIGGTP